MSFSSQAYFYRHNLTRNLQCRYYIYSYIYNYIGIYDGNPSDTTDSKLEDPQVPTYAYAVIVSLTCELWANCI